MVNSTCRADSEYSTTQLWCGPMVNSTRRADSEYSTTQLWCGPMVNSTCRADSEYSTTQLWCGPVCTNLGTCDHCVGAEPQVQHCLTVVEKSVQHLTCSHIPDPTVGGG